MPLAKNVMGGGFSSAQAQAVNGNNVNSAVTAAGTALGTATALTADGNIVTGGGADAGVSLYDGQIGDSQWVFNNQLTNCRVYPPKATATINQIAAGACHILPQQTYGLYTKVTSTKWVAEMSA